MPALLTTQPDHNPDAQPEPPGRREAIRPLIQSVFAGVGEIRRPVTFEWRLIRRHQWPFLLLPVTVDAGVALKLYSPQRRGAKVAHAMFPLFFKTPAATLFERIQIEADADADFCQFLAQHAGVEPSRFSAPVIKFGGTGEKSRLVLLVYDETHRPVSVIKAGFGAEGRAATDREADLLAGLPPEKIGCTRLTGRFTSPTVSAFATAYYPGDSPADDAGLEHLFADWMNPEAPVPIESLEVWNELEAAVRAADVDAWAMIRPRLAGRKIRTTLYHGDFAPWNMRAINTRNLQAFDWERGSLRGIPGWDWFHFIVQTAVLARRLSVERVAAEMEQVLHSERFLKYATEAGIRDLVKPLFLASLLHQKWVVQPLEGGRRLQELFQLLSARWRMHPRTQFEAESARPAAALAEGPRPAALQLQFAAARLSNLFWEPSLNSTPRPTLGAQWRTEWRMILTAGGLLAAMILLHVLMNPHLAHLPFYLLPCALVTWRAGRHGGMLYATIAAVAGPLVKRMNDTDFHALYVVGWNMFMGFLMLQMCVLLFDRILRQQRTASGGERPNGPAGSLADNWAVVLASGLWLAAVITVQVYSCPYLGFLPVYLIPCAALTLTVGRAWGMAAAAVVAVAGPYIQRFGDPDYRPETVEIWNTITRFVVLQLIILLLDRLLRKNILFFASAPRVRPEASRAAVPANAA